MFPQTCRTRRSSASGRSSPSGLLSNLCQKGPMKSLGPFPSLPFSCKPAIFRSALGRTRTCDLLIRSHSPSETRADTEGQGETKQRFYQLLALLERQGGTGRDTRLRSDCGQCSRHPGFRTIGDSGGCEKRASELGDEAFEVGASPFIAGFNDIGPVSLTLWGVLRSIVSTSVVRESSKEAFSRHGPISLQPAVVCSGLPAGVALRLERRCSRFGHLLVLLDGAGAHADGAHDITVAAQGYAARKDHEVAPVRVAKAEEGPSRLCLVHQVLCLALEGYRGIGFIDRDGNASYESAIHPDVCLEVPTRVDYCDVHGAVDLLRLLFCGGDNPPRLL